MRLFTFFIYLHTPDGGGQTHFPNLNITIPPIKGSALLWPNVKDDDPRKADMRTEHEALPPTEGLKYSANLWLHQYDFRGPNVHGCDLAKRVRSRNAADRALPRRHGADLPGREGNALDNDEEEEDLHVEL